MNRVYKDIYYTIHGKIEGVEQKRHPRQLEPLYTEIYTKCLPTIEMNVKLDFNAIQDAFELYLHDVMVKDKIK